MVKAGAMVKAHKRYMVYDDAHLAKPEVINELLGPLERQRKAINKGGINTTVKTETPLLVVCNPKEGRFYEDDKARPLVDVINTKIFTQPFIDRMDIIDKMVNDPDPDRVRNMVKHMLQDRRGEVLPTVGSSVLKKYLYYCKTSFEPTLPEELDEYIISWVLTEMGSTSAVSGEQQMIFNRHINTIIRLSEASAKIRRKDVIIKDDVDRAFRLLKNSLITLTSEDGVTIDGHAYNTFESYTFTKQKKTLMEIMKDLQTEQSPIPESKIQEIAEQNNIEKWREALEKYHNEGAVIQPQTGKWQVV